MDVLLKASFMSPFSLLISVLYFKNVESAPEPYCLKTFNNSNCGMPRTPVFHYYKPGSRCEIVYWYGCPTANMFANEYQCSHHCIFRLYERSEPQEEKQTQEKKMTDELSELKPDELKEVDEVLNEVIEETTDPQETLINLVVPDENAAIEDASEVDATEEPVHTEEENSQENEGPEPEVPPEEKRGESVEFG